MKVPERYHLSRDQIASLVGPVNDTVISAIFDLKPTAKELDEAIVWASGANDVMGEMERPQSAKVGRIIEILTLEEDYGEEG